MKKTLLLALAAVASVAAAAPALAQPFQRGPVAAPTMVRFDGGVDARIGLLDSRIDQAQRMQRIGRRQATQLQNQLRQIRFMEQRYRFGDGGRLTGWQQADLNTRLDQVSAQLGFGGRDGGGRPGFDGHDGGPSADGGRGAYGH